ncbi:MAG TPA: SemiSWEET family transporter [Nitrosarchaeum sp.]|jgi:MtN3 and saliva related transmembrane protein|nr:SemiSWEET family transporter [Nitrosarchaeum sp.]
MEIDGTLLIILGISAGILILSGWVDQIIKGYKTKSLKDVSKYLMLFISGGSILWLVYGIVMSDVFIIGTNTAAIILMMIVLFMKRRYEKTSKINQ